MTTASTTPSTTSSTVAPTLSKLDQILNDILTYTEVVTEVAASIPSVSGLASIALKFEQIAQAGLLGLAASQGQTVTQVIAQLHQETSV